MTKDMKVAEMTEKQLSQAIVSAARECGWLVNRPWLSIHSPKGFPDLFLVRDRKAFALELKSAKGKPSPQQLEWIEALKQVPGVDARIVYPSNLEAVYQALVTGEWT